RYLAQISGVYALHGIIQPRIVPRLSVTVVEPPVRRILDQFGLEPGDYQADRQGTLQRVLLERAGQAERFELALQGIASGQAELLEAVASLDPTLEGAVDKHAERLKASLYLLRSKAAAALQRRDSDTTRQFARLDAHLFPGGGQQERVLSPFGPFLKFGVGPVMRLFANAPATGSLEL